MKGFQVFRNLATDEECQAIVDSIDRQEDDWLQNRWEVKKFEIPQSVIDKAQKCLGDEKIIASRVQTYLQGNSFAPHRDAIWYSIPVHGSAKQVCKRDRNLSMSILLNDEFEGGDLIIGGQNTHLKKGDGVMFSAMSLHWVNGILDGCRMSVAVWSGTWDFKEITKEEEMRLAKIQDDMDREFRNVNG